jgi:hypothetical protein
VVAFVFEPSVVDPPDTSFVPDGMDVVVPYFEISVGPLLSRLDSAIALLWFATIKEFPHARRYRFRVPNSTVHIL